MRRQTVVGDAHTWVIKDSLIGRAEKEWGNAMRRKDRKRGRGDMQGKRGTSVRL